MNFKDLPPGHDISAHKDTVGQEMHRWKRGELHSGRGKGGKPGKIVKSQDQAIAIALSVADKSKKGKTSNHAERLMSMGYSEEVADEVASMLDGTYDFTRCERPDGSTYGTSGQCRKGREVKKLEERIKRQEKFLRNANPANYSPREIEIEKKELQRLKSQLAGMKSTMANKGKKTGAKAEETAAQRDPSKDVRDLD